MKREFGIALGAIIFVAGTFRELRDMLEAFDGDPVNTPSAIMVGVFVVIGIACAWFSFTAIGEPEAKT